MTSCARAPRPSKDALSSDPRMAGSLLVALIFIMVAGGCVENRLLQLPESPPDVFSGPGQTETHVERRCGPCGPNEECVGESCECKFQVCTGECCDDGEICGDSGQCRAPIDGCKGRECGDDGHGGSCGDCESDGLWCTHPTCIDGSCDFGDLTTGICLIDGSCRYNGQTNPADACLACNPANPLVWGEAADGAPCDDGELCTVGDLCEAGICQPGTGSHDCDDGNPCTDNACEIGKGCISSNGKNWEPCADDEDFLCQDGECVKACGSQCNPTLENCVGTSTGGVACSAKMVEIPEGSFWMGCNNCPGTKVADKDCDDDEHPYHEVFLEHYEIDATEVTADQYATCESAGGCDPTDTQNVACTWQKEGKGNRPINCVTWFQAEGYCLWAGKKLCTEAQWEKAARGGCEENGGPSNCHEQTQKYPWGNDAPDGTLAVSGEFDGHSQDVCSKSPAGDSPYGLCDMAGNLWEWVGDRYQEDYYCVGPAATGEELCPHCGSWPGFPEMWGNPGGPVSGSPRGHRGGSYGGTQLRTSNRAFSHPSTSGVTLGFRCCRQNQ